MPKQSSVMSLSAQQALSDDCHRMPHQKTKRQEEATRKHLTRTLEGRRPTFFAKTLEHLLDPGLQPRDNLRTAEEEASPSRLAQVAAAMAGGTAGRGWASALEQDAGWGINPEQTQVG
jgi:hypothetical protein